MCSVSSSCVPVVLVLRSSSLNLMFVIHLIIVLPKLVDVDMLEFLAVYNKFLSKARKTTSTHRMCNQHDRKTSTTASKATMTTTTSIGRTMSMTVTQKFCTEVDSKSSTTGSHDDDTEHMEDVGEDEH